jgi:hypothetical protein
VSCCAGVVQGGLLLWWTVRLICVESGRRAGGRGCEGDLRLCLGVVVGESKVDPNLAFVVHNVGDVVVVVVGGDIVVDVSFPPGWWTS